MIVADVILPLPLNSVFTYVVPQTIDNIDVGYRVIVQFGKKKYYTAIVVRIYEQEDKGNDLKEILSVLDKNPVVLPAQLDFWQWIAFYYMCSVGEVYRAALPSALKLESETLIKRVEGFTADSAFTPTEQQILYTLSESNPLKISEIAKEVKISNIVPYIKSLVDKGAAITSENIRDAYTSKTETRVKLFKNFTDTELSDILDSLSRAKKQQQLLSTFLLLQNESDSKSEYSILKKELLDTANINSSILDGLVERNILTTFKNEISRFNFGQGTGKPVRQLNKEQQEAYTQIQKQFKDKQTVLLHGVTGSGKTEIYIHLIQDALNKNKQVLYLLPEIALTTQITERLKSVFGDKLLVYHSKFSDNERAEIWKQLLDDEEGKIVLGARSAIFLPFRHLDLIIVDEEHESSYKQQDPAPRYNAKNAAVVLAGIHNTNVLLGTATPSIETYFNVVNQRYGIVHLNNRYDNISLPHIELVNTKELKRTKQMKYVLSPPLIDKMNTSLSKKEQIILFQNRRGFSPMIECKVCSWTPQCEHCDVSLTYHKGQRMMVCHYCGATYRVPTECPNCETPTLQVAGFGTERVEEEVKELFPEASIDRMDLDTTRSKRSYERIIGALEDGLTDILIGTQMVSKGLDFDNVSIVSVLNADSLLNYPDFRAHEKAFQMMTQVSGRAGRKNKQGLVIIQTSQPQHPVITCVANNDYNSFYQIQTDERKLFDYPPFCRLISIILKGRDEKSVNEAATQYAGLLRTSFDNKVLGPTKPVISRIQSLYIRNILLKVDNQASPQKVRDAIHFYQQHLKKTESHVSIYYDVDPLM